MAKKSMLARESKRKKLVVKYAEKRKIILNELKLMHGLYAIFLLNVIAYMDICCTIRDTVFHLRNSMKTNLLHP